jgi:hypothetical protein
MERCLYTDYVYAEFRDAWKALGPRSADDLALHRSWPLDPCPFPGGDTDPNGSLYYFFPSHRIQFYQVEGADIRDLRVVKDTDAAVMNVRIFY